MKTLTRNVLICSVDWFGSIGCEVCGVCVSDFGEWDWGDLPSKIWVPGGIKKDKAFSINWEKRITCLFKLIQVVQLYRGKLLIFILISSTIVFWWCHNLLLYGDGVISIKIKCCITICWRQLRKNKRWNLDAATIIIWKVHINSIHEIDFSRIRIVSLIISDFNRCLVVMVMYQLLDLLLKPPKRLLKMVFWNHKLGSRLWRETFQTHRDITSIRNS